MSPATNNTKSKNKKQNNQVRNTIIVVVMIGVIGIVGYLINGRSSAPSSAPPKNFISYPLITSSIVSSSTGREHHIDIDIVVEYENGVEDTVSKDEAFAKISDIIASLDYDRLREIDSIDHIESEVANGLETVAGSGNISNVYVTNIAIDRPGVIESTRTVNTQNNEVLKGLFQNLED